MMAAPRKKKWTAIVLTCTHMDASYAYQRELEIRQEKGYIDKDVILLTAEDPKSQVGSGGATLNALLMVSEYISAKQGFSVVNADVLQDAHIIIIHAGRKYPYDPCGRPFLTFPAKPKQPEYDCLVTHVDILIELLTEKIAVNSPPGVWVCSTEMLITLTDNTVIEWEPCDVYALTIPEDKEKCRSHSIYKLDDEGFVEDILYKASMDSINECVLPSGKVPVLCGIVYLGVAVCQQLLSFHVKPPLDACTYMGVDNGSPPLQLSFFFDVMLPMASGVNEEAFVSGDRSGVFGMSGSTQYESSGELKTDRAIMKTARQLIWKNLSDLKIRPCIVEGSYHYLGSRGSDHHEYQLNCPLQTMKDLNLVFKNKTHSYIDPSCNVCDSCVVVNSVLTGGVVTMENTAISHSCIEGEVTLGKDSLYTGVKLDNSKSLHPVRFANSVVVQGFYIHLKTLGTSQHVLTVHGRFDNLHASVYEDPGTFCNEPWEDFLLRTGIVKEDLWDTKNPKEQTLATAKLFPVFHATENVGLKECLWLQGEAGATLRRWRSSWRISLHDIMSYGDIVEEFESRRRLFYEVSKREIENTLIYGLDNGFCCVYNSARVEGASADILETLDKVALSSESPGVVARVLANIADVLGSMAGHKGGLRSGPACNLSWAKPFVGLEKGELKDGIRRLAKVRRDWLGRPDLLIRAARHYEGAAQILIRQAVMTGRQFFHVTKTDIPPVNKWVTVECPARIDLAGGWSDTPPICYEHGGAVTNMALLIDGKRPIGAKVRRIPEPVLILVIRGEGSDFTTVTVRHLSDLKDYNQPHAQGALLKAAFICANIIQYPCPYSLDEQLRKKYDGGFELESWSHLPRGSGLGTSSILAGAIMCALLRASGQTTDIDGLNHAVLHLEQMLTTGGGWQDQIGGLVPGVKIGISEGKLPVKIKTKIIKVSPATIKALNERMVLVFTGRPRLARNLLQDVVRNWYSRTPEIVETEDGLVHVAWESAKALEDGDIEKVGNLLDKYWALKRRMAVGSEPVACTRMMTAIRPYAHGMVLAGAGGGGFLFIMMKNPNNPKDKVREILATVEGGENAVVYDACIDENGMTVVVEE
ncbi:L-fucose kinase-like [Liolophura sinensis]|uniref:L-fucose kinase-like n=1 Tax=Liolophura sinensis TaxID=3198878 RepID=UPI00315911D5